MEVTLGVSNKHVHLNDEDYHLLFGNEKIEVVKKLVQKNQYASNLFVDIKAQKNILKHIRVLGAIRNYTQVELSKTDSFFLGINPPIRDSGDLEGAEEVTIIGPCGSITKKVAIIATRHIHLNSKDVLEKNLTGKKEVDVTFNSEKSVTFHNVKLKIQEEGIWEMHIDTDDANGSFLKTGDIGTIITK